MADVPAATDIGPKSTQPDIARMLRQHMASPDFQPAILPQTAIELMDLARDKDVGMARIVEVIEREPVIAAEVLSTARSALYSRGNPIESLEQAAVRLGIAGVSGLFMAAALRKTALNCKLFARSMEQLRRHMVATAHIARGVCTMIKKPGDRAFVCGLLHDIGIAGALTAIAELPQKHRPKNLDAIRGAALDVHQEASALMGVRWHLPWGTQWIIGHHHDFMVDGRVSPLAALTLLSCHLAGASGAPALDEQDDEPARHALDYFEIEGNAESRLRERCQRVVDLIE